MRKRMLLLTLSLAALAGALTAPAADAGGEGGSSCPQCTYYSDGSKCCVPCWCENGIIVACTNLYCPPADGGDGRD